MSCGEGRSFNMINTLSKILLSKKVLNKETSDTAENQNANKIAQNLNKKILSLYGEFLNEYGTEVDYKGMSDSPKFKEFEELTLQLKNVDLSTLSEKEFKPFFINLYNVCLIHGYVNLGHPSNMVTRLKFYSEVGYLIGPNFFSLNDIEHGILRGNKNNNLTGLPQFDKKDSRLQYICKELDPRIHFALVCGAKSCPPIRIFSSENCDYALEQAAKSFCNNNITFKDNNKDVELSMIFKWYGDDFGKDVNEVLLYIKKYLNEENKEKLNTCLSHKDMVIKYANYDWSINSAD